MRKERTWPGDLVTRLQMVAQIFANALARRRAEQELRESEERLSLAADSAGAGLWGLDLASGTYWLTSKTRNIFHFSPNETVTFEQFLSLVHPDDQSAVRQVVQEMIHTKGEGSAEYRIVQPDGTFRWMSSRGRLRSGGDTGPESLMGVTIDITPRKQAEEALHHFSARLIQTQEEERARLARELHDDITQQLARLAIDVGQCETGESNPSTSEMVRTVRTGLIQLSEDVHALSYRLHPSILEDLGLAAALKAETERIERQAHVSIEVVIKDVPEPVSRELALCIFRVAQEALRNAVRHSGAGAITLSLRPLEDGLQLAVQDDGCGFDPALQRDHPSLGIASMRERVHLLGGELDIESSAGHGTTVIAWLPLGRVEGSGRPGLTREAQSLTGRTGL